MGLILPKFVKNLIEFFIILFVVMIVGAILSFYLLFESVGYIPLEEIFFWFNLFFIFATGFIVFLYQYADDIVIYISLIMFFISAILSFVSFYYRSHALIFIGYMVLSILIILHKKNYLKIN